MAKKQPVSDDNKLAKKWQTRIARAEKFLEKTMDRGRKIYARYQDDRTDDYTGGLKRANVFYSNVNTLRESLFNSMPKPDCSRLQKGDWEDDVSRVAALIVQRGLTYEVHCAPDFKGATRGAILDRLVPGIGQVWYRFDAQLEESQDPITGEVLSVVTPNSERISVEYVYWEDFLYEPTRNWDAITWVGRRLRLSKAEITKRWGEQKASQIEAVNSKQSNITPKEVDENKFQVFEVWDKTSRKVLHIAKGLEEPLDVSDDPYQLTNFFPCPRALIANATTNAYLPIADYYLAQDQYDQLDTLYARISLLIEAVKVAGCYDASSQEIGRMLEGAENVLIPVDKWAMYAESGGAKGMIDWYPVETVVNCLTVLQQQFEAVKGVLYEVTGMSDIIRGASNQYETAAAQQIKAQFASVRMNGYQRDVAEFVTDGLNIMAEMMVQLYGDEKLRAIVGKLSDPDEALVPEAMALLRNDFLSKAKVSIEADSLVQADWALEKQQRVELIQYVSTYLQAAVPAVQEIPEMGTLLLSMLKFAIAPFRGSAEIEGIIDQQLQLLVEKSQNPQPPKPSPEEMKFQLEQQKAQQDMQLKQQELESKAQYEAQKAQMELVKMKAELQHQQRMYALELEKAQLELQLKREEAQLDRATAIMDHQMSMQASQEQHEQSMEQREEASGREETGEDD